MRQLKDETNLEPIIKAICSKTHLTEASVINHFTLNDDWSLADFFGLKPASLNALYSDQASIDLAQIFDLNQSELQNLIDEFGKEFVIGMLTIKLLK